MRILIGCPVPVMAIAGPATIARELSASFKEAGDDVRVITFSKFERKLPYILRLVAFAVRAFVACWWAERVLLLDPASTGPALMFVSNLLARPTVLRIGGDFLWESYVERTTTPILLSEFYTAPRKLTFRESTIRRATIYTLHHSTRIAFTTEWQRALWRVPYGISMPKTVVIENALPAREAVPVTGKVFLSAHRNTTIKNGALLERAWKRVLEKHPDAVIDTQERAPEEYRDALKDAYAVIVPSLSEVSPNAIYEAVRFGKPFITTRDTGIYEEFKTTGLFIDTREEDAFVTAVDTLMDPKGYEEVQARTKAFTKVRAWMEVATEFRSVLESARLHP